jgi:hypothetical protein
MKKFGINGQMQNEPFLIFIYRSALVKADMNDARICKLRNDVDKTPQFLLFSMSKGRTKTIARARLKEEARLTNFLFYSFLIEGLGAELWAPKNPQNSCGRLKF